MNRIIKNLGILAIAISLAASFTSCEAAKNTNQAQRGAAIGAVGGAVLGAIIGNNVGGSDGTAVGAVIGGVVGGTAGTIIGNRMDQQAKRIEEEIPGVQIDRIEDAIVITFDEGSGVHFATNQHSLNEESRRNLDRLYQVMVEFEDTNLIVAGHTDSTGPRDFNMRLSRQRAESVANYLIAKGLDRNRFTIEWFGPDNPTHDNSTVEGRAKNRRVNVGIVPNQKMIEEAQREAGQN